MIEQEKLLNPEKKFEINIPENEYKIIFSRSSGKGGQNVNKVSTKATLIFNIPNSKVLSPEQKERIFEYWRNRISQEGNFIIYSESERSQSQNKQEVIEKLHRFIFEALKPEKERIPTKPRFSAKAKRLEEKKRQSQKKELRKKIHV